MDSRGKFPESKERDLTDTEQEMCIAHTWTVLSSKKEKFVLNIKNISKKYFYLDELHVSISNNFKVQ